MQKIYIQNLISELIFFCSIHILCLVTLGYNYLTICAQQTLSMARRTACLYYLACIRLENLIEDVVGCMILYSKIYKIDVICLSMSLFRSATHRNLFNMRKSEICPLQDPFRFIESTTIFIFGLICQSENFRGCHIFLPQKIKTEIF